MAKGKNEVCGGPWGTSGYCASGLNCLKICRYLHPNLVVVYISGNPSLTDQEGWTDKLIYSKNTMWYKRPHKQPLKQGMEFEVKWSWGKTL